MLTFPHTMDIDEAAKRWPLTEDGEFPDEVLYRHWRSQHDDLLKRTEAAGSALMWATLAWCRTKGKTYEQTVHFLLGRFSQEANDFGQFGEVRAAYMKGMGSAVYRIQCELWNMRDTGTGWWVSALDDEATDDGGFSLVCTECGESFDADQVWLDSLDDDEPIRCGVCQP